MFPRSTKCFFAKCFCTFFSFLESYENKEIRPTSNGQTAFEVSNNILTTLRVRVFHERFQIPKKEKKKHEAEGLVLLLFRGV